MAGPQPQRIALFISAFILLLTTHGVNSVSLPSCTGDCPLFIPGAVAYWPLTLKTKGLDMSGHGNNATFVGLTYTDGPNGEPNGAVHFHGNRNSYAWITTSSSMEVGNYPGFSACGFVRFSIAKNAPILEWRPVLYGLHIEAYPSQDLWINLYTSNGAIKQNAGFPNMKFTTGSWRFFGVSYDKATGRVTGFMDGLKEQKQIDKNIVAETAEASKVGLGIYLSNMDKFNYNGDMSCMMLFKVALTADDFERVCRFCRDTKKTHTTLLNITVSDIATTTASASWTKSPGTFSGYSIAIERNQIGPRQESTDPQSIPSSVLYPRVTMANLIPGATYRIKVWHMQGAIKGGARTSSWFFTKPAPVETESITFSAITVTSAEVTWGEATGNFDGYSVDISPTTGGAKVDPSTVPRGTSTTSLRNLSPGSYYTITIRTKIGSALSSPSTKSFVTPAVTYPTTIAVIGLVVAVICLVAMVAFIVMLFRRNSFPSTNNVDVTSLPMSNPEFQTDEPSTSKTQIHEENDGYEVPDRSQYGGNSGSQQMPHQWAKDNNGTTADDVYENFSN